MKEIYFENIEGVGNLYLDKVLNKFEDEDIIFTCMSEKNEYFFCVCYEFRYKLGWVICKVSPLDLIQMFYKYTDIHSLFKKANAIIQVIEDECIRTEEIFTYDTIEKKYLPTESVFFRENLEVTSYKECLVRNFVEALKKSYFSIVPYAVEETNDMVYSYGISKGDKIQYDLSRIAKSEDEECCCDLNDAA